MARGVRWQRKSHTNAAPTWFDAKRCSPGEATPWHRDPYRRLAVVLSGDALRIEYRDGTSKEIAISPGQTDWDEPMDKIHRGVNAGKQVYEEVTVFFLDRPDAIPQPTWPD